MFKRRPADLKQFSDSGLLERYRKTGNREIVGELYKRYVHLVYGVCLKYLKNREDSKDAVMQIFEKLMETLQTHEVKHFKSWLFITSRNHCLMELRRRKSNRNLSSDEYSLIGDMEIPDELHLNDEMNPESDIDMMKKCMEGLPHEQKICISMFYFEEQSYKEVSLKTRFPLKKVKSYIQNGKRNLKNCMERKSE